MSAQKQAAAKVVCFEVLEQTSDQCSTTLLLMASLQPKFN